jgi:hypothetical protein
MRFGSGGELLFRFSVYLLYWYISTALLVHQHEYLRILRLGSGGELLFRYSVYLLHWYTSMNTCVL